MPLMSRAADRIRALTGLMCLCTLLVSAPTHAEIRGLIMAIAEYPAPAALPGVKYDVALAQKLAKWMRVPDRNLTVIQNGALQLDGFRQTLQDFSDRVRPGDDVFLYYSGHGGRMEVQREGARPQCAEAFVATDLKFFMDKDFKAWLQGISDKAAKVIVFADSCHSGGVVDAKGLSRSLSSEKLLPKTIAKAGSDSVNCEPVNLAKTVVMTRSLRSNAVFIAAARDDEVAWSTSRGSIASMAWANCLEQGGLVKDGSGSVTVDELHQCAQRWIDEKGYNQHLHVVGNNRIVLGFNNTSTPLRPAVGTGTVTPVPAPAPVAALNGLLDKLAANGDPKRSVSIRPVSNRVMIGRDRVEFDVATAEPGYLFLLYLGSDEKTLDLIYPNKVDSNNYIQAGTHRFPRSRWGLTATGPAGIDRIVAIVSPSPRNFNALAAGELGPFSLLVDGSRPNESATRNLMVEAINPTTLLATDCGTRNLSVVVNQQGCVTAYGVGEARIEEVR